MKIQFALFAAMTLGIMASPALERRQNDVQECVNGQGDNIGEQYTGLRLLPASKTYKYRPPDSNVLMLQVSRVVR
jgi:hypothetical protein